VNHEADIAVVGAGPAGLSAARAAAAAGAKVVVLDEYAEPGGQFYKQLPSAFAVPERAHLDADYTKGDALFAAVRTAGVTLLQETLVWASFAPGELSIVTRGAPGTVRARAIVVASGAYERAVAFPGWDLPGVMTPGGVQTLAKAQRVAPGERIVLAGSGPFLMPVAKSLIAIGACIAGIFEATRPRDWVHRAFALRGHGDRIREAASYRRLIADAGVPVHFGEIVVEALGADRLERVRLMPCDAAGRVPPGGRAREVEADTLCVGYGFIPGVQLTRHLGCAHRHDAVLGGWVPVHDDSMHTSVPGVFVAGEVAGIGGAPVAAAEGTLAGLAAARSLGFASPDAEFIAARRERAHRRAFSRLVGELFPVKPAYYDAIDDDTLVCRCEEVSAGEVRSALAAWGGDVNFIKGVTRCGMGYCQGRICAGIVEALATKQLGLVPGGAGAPSVRAPLKPVTVETLAALERE